VAATGGAGMTAEEIAGALGGKRSGKGWLCRCPAHDDNNASFSVAQGDKGVVFHCHAGCSQDDVLEALRRIGLWPEPDSNGSPRRQRIVAIYDYTDASGNLLYQVVRLDPKDFRQRRPDGKGGLIWSQGDRRVLYRWPDLVAYPDATLGITEGEKDAERLATLGLVATTVANGNWNGVDVEAVRGRDVWIFEDADKAGVKKALATANALHGVARTIRVVRLPGHEHTAEKHGKDVSDWLDENPARGVDDIAEACRKAALWEPAGPRADNDNEEEFDAVELDQTEFDPVKSVVPGLIVEGLTLLCGKPKLGKSWLLLHVANATATGGFTLGDLHCIEGDVLYCSLEDNKRRLKSRMRKLFSYQQRSRRLKFRTKMPRLAQGGLDVLREWIKSVPNPRLVAIDTLAMVRMPNRKDQSAYDADYAAVIGLRELAHEFGVAVVVVHHVRKMDADDPFDTISGTLGLTGCPDSLVILKRDAAGVMLMARGRDIEEYEKVISFNKVTCKWTVVGDADTVRRSSEQQAILAALNEGNGPLTPRQIATETGMRVTNIKKMLARMVTDGCIEKVDRGQYQVTPPGKRQDAA
jgi:predicted transcriptional regulator